MAYCVKESGRKLNGLMIVVITAVIMESQSHAKKVELDDYMAINSSGDTYIPNSNRILNPMRQNAIYQTIWALL